MTEFLTTPEIDEAWDRIARTSDGGIIYRHLMKLLMELSNDDSALPRCEGARSLAHNLMRLMAKGIIDSDRYCVAFPGPTVTRAEPGRGARRRITEHTFVPGYDQASDAGGSGSGTNGTGNGSG